MTRRRVHFESRSTVALSTAPIPTIPKLRRFEMPRRRDAVLYAASPILFAACVAMLAAYAIGGAS